jgi:hypothetical protein
MWGKVFAIKEMFDLHSEHIFGSKDQKEDLQSSFDKKGFSC